MADAVGVPAWIPGVFGHVPGARVTWRALGGVDRFQSVLSRMFEGGIP